MSDKPEIVEQYEAEMAAGASLYFDPVEIEDIFHYYAEEGRMDKEEEVLRLAQRLHPDDYVTHMLEAEYLLNMDDAEGCLRALEALSAGGEMDNGKWTMDNGEESVMYCILKSGALAMKGDLSGAIEYGERAVSAGGEIENGKVKSERRSKEDEEERALIAYDVGLGFMNANQPAVALRYYTRCLAVYPEDLRTLLGIIYCLVQVGTAEEVIRYADRALEVDSFCVDAWIAKGNALGEQGKWAEAEECCDYAMAIQPENGECILMKVNCCVQQGRYEEALEEIERGKVKIERGESKANMLLLAAHLYAEKKQKDEAVEAIWSALEACPRDKDIVTRVAYAFIDCGEPTGAVVILRDMLRREGDQMDPQLMMLLGEQYTQLGDYEHAADTYEQLVKLSPSATVWTMLGASYMSLYKYRKAYKYLKMAAEEEPIWQTYVLLAVCAHEMGWETAAASNYILAHELNAPGAAELLKGISPLLTESFEKNGIFREAEEWRQRKLVRELLRAEAEKSER